MASLKAVRAKLFIRHADPELTVLGLRDILAASGQLFERGVPVRIAHDAAAGGAAAHPLTPDTVIRLAHGACRPVVRAVKDGETVDTPAALPRTAATMYLDMRGEWGLPPLHGIAAAPLLDDAGGIRTAAGYDAATGLWCERVPEGIAALVPDRPSRADAERAFGTLRHLLRTWAFAGAATVAEPEVDVPVVDPALPPGPDEGAALAALLTAVCRPSLKLAPGLMVRAAPFSGAGAGKGLLVRVICAVAYGQRPSAVTAGTSPEELDKRLGAELMGGGPVLFLDNLNDLSLKSDTLASAITESPARIRLLGKSQMVPVNAQAFIALTGNGLSVREDLQRRVLQVELDPGTENPELRRFPGDVERDAAERRPELLAAALTVWRWGRLLDAEGALEAGLPLGSFGDWCRWVRDPLGMLGCPDPVARISERHADAVQQETAQLLRAWHKAHGPKGVRVPDLGAPVLALLDPSKRGRHFVAASLARLRGVRAGGFKLVLNPMWGTHGPASYSVLRTAEADTHAEASSSYQETLADECEALSDRWHEWAERYDEKVYYESVMSTDH